MKTLGERFGEKWVPEPNTGCWLWSGSLTNAYGQIRRSGRLEVASRVSWELHIGPIPEGQNVLHKCDTPACVNPAHLFLGSQRDNVVDMLNKGRSPHFGTGKAHGEHHGVSRLTSRVVREIRTSTLTQSAMARQFGVSRKTIQNVLSGRLWSHVK